MASFPSHTELYKDFHKIEPLVFMRICEAMGWNWYNYSYQPHPLKPKQDFEDREICAIDHPDKFEVADPPGYGKVDMTKWSLEFEVDGWDIVYRIKSTPVFNGDQEEWPCLPFLIEYKSHIEEWGKQFDQFIRQIKKRKAQKNSIVGRPFLVSFDPQFRQFSRAAITAGFSIIVLDEEVLRVLHMSDQDAEDYYTKIHEEINLKMLEFAKEEEPKARRAQQEQLEQYVRNAEKERERRLHQAEKERERRRQAESKKIYLEVYTTTDSRLDEDNKA